MQGGYALTFEGTELALILDLPLVANYKRQKSHISQTHPKPNNP